MLFETLFSDLLSGRIEVSVASPLAMVVEVASLTGLTGLTLLSGRLTVTGTTAGRTLALTIAGITGFTFLFVFIPLLGAVPDLPLAGLTLGVASKRCLSHTGNATTFGQVSRPDDIVDC